MTQAVTVRLPARTSSVRQARTAARDTLAGWQAGDFEWALCQLVSEVVTNAVIHAGTALEVTLVLQGPRLRCEVHDGSPAPVRVRHYSAEAATGRGLHLVEHLATSWGVSYGPDGKTVWFELEAPVSGNGEPDLDLFLGVEEHPPQGWEPAGRRGTGGQRPRAAA